MPVCKCHCHESYQSRTNEKVLLPTQPHTAGLSGAECSLLSMHFSSELCDRLLRSVLQHDSAPVCVFNLKSRVQIASLLTTLGLSASKHIQIHTCIHTRTHSHYVYNSINQPAAADTDDQTADTTPTATKLKVWLW